jgi:hypothetical protein
VREDEARRQELLRREQETRREPPAPAPAPVDRRQDAPAAVPPPAPRRRTALIGGIVVALVAVAAVIWGAWPRSQPPPPPPLTSVLIDIKPWARIESITRAGGGGAVPIPETTTPSVLALAPGEYHVRVSNPFFPQGLEFDVRIEAGAYQEIRRALPDVNPEDEFKKLLEGR